MYPRTMLHLASKSPRRRELLRVLGLEFGILDLDLPETPALGELPEDYVRRVAREKAGAGLLRVIGQPQAVVLGADDSFAAGTMDDAALASVLHWCRRRGESAALMAAQATLMEVARHVGERRFNQG